jgi:hypothetical protein
LRGLASAAGVLALTAATFAQSALLERVRAAAEGGDFAAAARIAGEESDAGLRAQAEVWLYFRAADFARAYDAALDGLAVRPDDPWIAERAGACAWYLRSPANARAAAERLAAIVRRLPETERATWSAALGELEHQAGLLESEDRRASAAEARARWVALLALAACAGAGGWLAWRARGYRMSSTPSPLDGSKSEGGAAP